MSEHNEALRRALALAPTDPQTAVSILEAELTRVRGGQARRAVSSLARHAGILCTQLGDLHRALQYYDEALSDDGDDPYLHFASGELRLRLGEVDAARRAFARSRELAIEQGEADIAKIASDAADRLQD